MASSIVARSGSVLRASMARSFSVVGIFSILPSSITPAPARRILALCSSTSRLFAPLTPRWCGAAAWTSTARRAVWLMRRCDNWRRAGHCQFVRKVSPRSSVRSGRGLVDPDPLRVQPRRVQWGQKRPIRSSDWAAGRVRIQMSPFERSGFSDSRPCASGPGCRARRFGASSGKATFRVTAGFPEAQSLGPSTRWPTGFGQSWAAVLNSPVMTGPPADRSQAIVMTSGDCYVPN